VEMIVVEEQQCRFCQQCARVRAPTPTHSAVPLQAHQSKPALRQLLYYSTLIRERNPLQVLGKVAHTTPLLRDCEIH
jgi:hypothetical protein